MQSRAKWQEMTNPGEDKVKAEVANYLQNKSYAPDFSVTKKATPKDTGNSKTLYENVKMLSEQRGTSPDYKSKKTRGA